MISGSYAVLWAGVAVLAAIVVLQMLTIVAYKSIREWRTAVLVHQRALFERELFAVLDHETAFAIRGRVVSAGDHRFVLPAAGAAAGIAATETLTDYLLFAGGTIAPRLIRMLEDGGYVARSTRRLRSPWRHARLRAATLLGAMQSAAAVPALLRAFRHDRSAHVRITAAEALGAIGNQEIADHLIGALRTSTRFEQIRIADVLSRMGDRATRALLFAIHHPDENVAVLAFDALITIGRLADPAPVRRKLRHPSAEIRGRAAELLGVAGDVESVPALLRLLADPSWFVQVRAIKALGRIGAPVQPRERAHFHGALAGKLASDAWWVRHVAAEALAVLSEEGRDRLRALSATSASPAVRSAAVSALQLRSLRDGLPLEGGPATAPA